jgi:hypothetical protein
MHLTKIICCLLCFIQVGGIVTVGQNARATSLRGNVTDLFGSPLPDAGVEVLLEDGTRLSTTHTDQQGVYNFADLPVARLKIVVKLRGFREEEITLPPKTGQQVLDVGLKAGQLFTEPLIEISGSVRQATGGPAARASVTIVNAYNQRLAQTVKTDKDGKYNVTVYDPGQYVIYASQPGFKVCATAIVLPATFPRESRVANFELPPLGSQ